MSELRLALPECKYRNDADELLKEQFIFGIYNKEIQDHLLGEIKETDNSLKSLYVARKIESKLAQRQMLGIVNPSLVSIKEIKNKASNMIMETQMMVIETLKVTKSMITVNGATEEVKEIAQHMAKNVINVVERTTSGLCVSPRNLSQNMTQEGQLGPREEILMKLNVRMTWRTLQNRSSHCFIIENHRDFWK